MTQPAGPHESGLLLATGRPLAQAAGALILLHGRGATAESILELAPYLPHPDLAYLAPQADDFTWYPYSFLSPVEQNEPHLSRALETLRRLVEEIADSGIPRGATMPDHWPARRSSSVAATAIPTSR